MMLKRVFFGIVITMCSAVSAAQTKSHDSLADLDAAKLKLASAHAMVVDTKTGKTLFAKNEDEVTPIASITKLMTAMVVLDAKQDMDEMLEITRDDRDALKNTYSRMRFGTQATRHDLLRLALMSSENRAASCLGRNYPGGLPAFVKAMNAKAAKLGMIHTHYEDSTGLSSENVSTAGDLAKLVAHANAYPLIHEFTTTEKRDERFRKPRYSLAFYNTNLLVRNDRWDIEVSKTGYTDEAGRCLVMLAKVAEHPVAIVLLDAVGKRSPVGDAGRIKRWMETGVGGKVPAGARRYSRTSHKKTHNVSVVASND